MTLNTHEGVDRLKFVDSVGLDPDDNLLIEGEALESLRAVERHGGYGRHFVGHVKLAYLDPPFNTGQNYKHYRDNVDHSSWNANLRDTLVAVRRFLSEDGSVWLHLDNSEQHRARLLLDDVFGDENFMATVIWERTQMPRLGKRPFATRHDYIHVYRKSDAFQLCGPVDGPVETIWRVDEAGSTEVGTAESKGLFGEPFSTPKPERLLAKIIGLGTDPSDLVLDCFAGSGTTPAVAHKLGRRWLAIEVERDTTRNFLKPRLQQVTGGSDLGGISPDVAWTGGGGFTHLALDRSTASEERPRISAMKDTSSAAKRVRPRSWSETFAKARNH